MTKSIVDIKNMGDALRNTGYKNIESAVSEIVDNSVEAEAKDIFIIIREEVNKTTGRKQVCEIAFLDNGIGMAEETLAGCLGIGTTTRTARKGMGRFGVGLPQASLYACPEVEVYSWQNGIENSKKVFLDIEKVKQGTQTVIEDPMKTDVPLVYQRYLTYVMDKSLYNFKEHGTLVIWKRCDRLAPKTRGPLIARLEFALGQKFRYFISDGTTHINIICDENRENPILVYPNDPLFLMDNNLVLGNPNYPGKIYYKCKSSDTDLEPYFEPYTGEDGKNKNGEVAIPIKHYDKDGNIITDNVIVKFSVVKNKFYDETAIPRGKNPGTTYFGKDYARKMEGISVVRAKREIDFRQFDFYDNINEPTHRWWGCEISFEPGLDEMFGVANNKQYVELKAVEKEDLDPDEVVQPVWIQIRSVVRNTIDAMYKRNEKIRKKTRSSTAKPENPTTTIVNTVESGNDTEGSATEEAKSKKTQEELIEKGTEELINQGVEQPTEEEVKQFINNKVNFKYDNLSKFGPAFDYTFELGNALITINIEHDFYKSFLKDLYEKNPVATVTIELFIASFVKAIDETAYQKDENDKLVTAWNEKLKKYIQEQLNPRKCE